MLSDNQSVVRKNFLGTPLDVLTMSQTLEMATQAMCSGKKITHVALNVAKLVNMRTDPVLRGDVTSADIIGIDGMGIVWGARLHGITIEERVAGIDLMWRLLAECEARGFRPYFLGATTEVVEAAAQATLKAYPRLKMAGMRNGYFTAEESAGIVEEINASGADCLFVGLPTPKKERFLAEHRQRLNAPFVMGVGGSYDVIGGKVARAPQWMQSASLEWLYRTLQEPRRLIWRYARTNLAFFFLLIAEFIRPASKFDTGRRSK